MIHHCDLVLAHCQLPSVAHIEGYLHDSNPKKVGCFTLHDAHAHRRLFATSTCVILTPIGACWLILPMSLGAYISHLRLLFYAPLSPQRFAWARKLPNVDT